MRIAPFEEKQAISIKRNFWVQLNGQFCMMENFVVHVFLLGVIVYKWAI